MNATNNFAMNANRTTTDVEKRITWLEKQELNFEEARFFWMAVIITAQSCLGSVACMFILKNHASDFVLAGCAAITMGCNAIFIAQAPARWCLGAFYLSVILNTVFIVVNV